MATLTPALTLSGTAADFGAVLSLSTSVALTANEPYIGISRITATTTGGESIIVPEVNLDRNVQLKILADARKLRKI